MHRLTIEKLDPVTGHGVAFDAGKPVTVPFTLAGDAIIMGAQGPALDTHGPAPRQIPPCRHFGQCGGCQLQHMTDDTLAAWKRQNVVNALALHGVEADVAPTVTVPTSSRRRARFTLQRTKKTALFGFRAAGEHRVVDMQHCAVLHPDILAALPDLRALALAGAPRKRPVTVQATRTESGLDVMAEEMKDLDLPLRETLAAIAERADFARVSWNGEMIAERRPPALSFGSATLHPPPGVFLQASDVAERLITQILSEALADARHIVDLFSGCGTFTLPLAAHTRVTALDSDRAAIAALDRAARHCTALHPVTATVHDLFRNPLLPEELTPFDAVVLDPPRAGAKAQVAQLAASAVPVIAMISCNPASFARDAKILSDGGYRVGRILPIDQFRWSPHTELVGIFRRP